MKNKLLLIRKVRKGDIDQLIELCRAHAHFEGASYSDEGVVDRLSEFIFSKCAPLHCFIVEEDSILVGYIAFTKEFSTWAASYYYHMDCLYLKEGYRKIGLGKQLMNEMITHAREHKIDHIQWQTPTTNTNAIDFYHHQGATSKAKQRFFIDL